MNTTQSSTKYQVHFTANNRPPLTMTFTDVDATIEFARAFTSPLFASHYDKAIITVTDREHGIIDYELKTVTPSDHLPAEYNDWLDSLSTGCRGCGERYTPYPGETLCAECVTAGVVL